MNELEVAFKWLSREEFTYPYHAIGFMAAQVERCVKEKKYPQARHLIEELKFATDAIANELVQAQVRIVCACAFFGMKEADDAFVEIDRAIAILEPHKHTDLDYRHLFAVANWLLGKLLLSMPSQHKAAVTCYQVCLDAFRNLVYWPDNLFNAAGWYEERCTQMKEEIEAVITGSITGIRAAKALRPSTAAHAVWPVSGPIKAQKVTLRAGPFTSIKVISEISAGLPLGVDPKPIETIKLYPEMDIFMIGVKAYHLYNLRTNERLITLKRTQDHSLENYYVLKVEGDSMDDRGIESGSYVLVRQQNTADVNDIVAAISVEGEITRATLKMYVKKNSTIELHPKSKNPKHKPIAIDKSQEATYIRGVAFGVFKLAPEQP